MPIGKFGEVIGTMNTLGDTEITYDTKVIAPKNPKLLRQRAPYIKITPSEYMFQMSLDTKKKLQNTKTMELPEKVELLDMGNTTYQKTTNVSMEDPIFQPFPSSMFFVNCEPHETHELPLILRNNDKVPRLVKVTHEDSPYFHVISPPNVSHKVAAGLPIVFKIQFTPEQRQDYKLNLIVVTEREKFIVPIHCIGSRAILDFPDEVFFTPTPLKYSETKTLFIRNVGNAVANFSITTTGPFTVEPSASILEINESMQLVLEFTPELPRDYSDEMVIHYDTGEYVYIRIHGSGQEIPVRLERSLVHIEETYVGLANLRKITLHNRSDIMIRFYWSNFSSQVSEDLDRETYLKILQLEENEEQEKYQSDENLGLLSSDKLSIVTRNYINKKKMYKEKKSRFVDDIFTIDPIAGEIWPHTSLDVTVAFKPTEARTYQSFAFCEVTGRETRLSLKITGVGIGPKVEFSFKTLEMGFIFIQAHHCYEIVLVNKGDIDALFKIEGSGSAVSRCFTFTPDDGLISPSSHQVVQIQFQSKEFLGAFNQQFKVKMDGCLEPSIISFKGIVIGPTFSFNVMKIKFGDVSVGFPSSEEIILQNTSLVPLQYCLRVPTDGINDPVLATDLDNAISPREYCTQYQPREFSVEPSEGILASMSSCKIIITLTANSIGKYHTALILDVIGVGDELYSLPITANAIVPQVELSSDELDFSRCFLEHPYEKSIKLCNSSNLPIKYEILKQTEMKNILLYSSSVNKAVVDPNSEIEIPIELKVLCIGEIITKMFFKIFGSTKEPLVLTVKCIGEGPVVNLDSVSLDWGTIKVLEDKAFTLQLSNESEIPAIFHANMLREQSVFRVEPKSGVLERHETLNLKIIANLNDCVKFNDELQLHIENSKTKIVPLIAVGFGTTIDFDPPILSVMDLGSHFSKTQLNEKFRVTNKGKRHQQLVWSNEGYSYTKAMRQTGTKNAMKAPILTVHPHRFDLSPGESADLIIQGYVDKPQVVHERIMCHAIIGRQGGKELIKKVDLEVNFISPVLEFSDRSLHFRLDKSNDNRFEILSKSISFSNVSGLQLNATLSVSYPFSILQANEYSIVEQKLCLDVNVEQTVTIQFNTLYKPGVYSKVIEDFLKITFDEHPHVDEIKLIGEVNFPNLQFDRTKINFDCILNHSEVTQFVKMHNISPLEVKYNWSLLVGDQPNIIFHRKHPVLVDEKETKELILDATEKDTTTEKIIEENIFSDQENECETSSKLEENVEVHNEVLENNETKLDLDLSENEQDIIEKIYKNRKKSLNIKRKSIITEQNSLEKPVINEKLKNLLETENEIIPLSIEEIFDVKPLYGTLKPNCFEQITFTYFGHSDVEAHVSAICEVEGGPTYRFELSGEASTVNYKFSELNFDFGQISYDQVAFKEIVLSNLGKVGFEFTSKGAASFIPQSQYTVRQPILIPISGFVEAGSDIKIKIGYLCGSPGKFSDFCQIQVAHFPMERINISGQGTFPRVTINLPRDSGKVRRLSDLNPEFMFTTKMFFDTDESFQELFERIREELSDKTIKMTDEEIMIYLEDVAVANHQNKIDSKALLEKSVNKGIYRLSLPAYCLDFGNVILGSVVSKTVKTKNTGHFQIHMKLLKSSMQQSGFFMNLNQVKNLPCQEEFEFEINFDPRAANLNLGIVENFLILNIIGGPCVPIKLIANVTMPDLKPNSEVVEFENVKVGEAKLITIQLHNPTPVLTEWTTLTSESDESLKSREHKSSEPRSMRKKKIQAKRDVRPLVFEMIPSAGQLKPGQRSNVQIKFMPLEEKSYSHRLIMMLAKSSKRIAVRCTGVGLEPKLEFKDGYMQFGPVLPFTAGCEKIINIKNPCSFPIEIYSLEFDKLYLEDEEILRHISGYDSFGNLLMPPRAAGDKLPSEFIEYYEEQLKRHGESDNVQKFEKFESQEVSEIEQLETSTMNKKSITEPSSKSVMSINNAESPALDELEQTPVSQAIARHLGLELTPEGKAARRNRGIAIVVIGSPMSGKTDTAKYLADKYSAALLTVDEIILDAISNGTTPAAKKARDFCLESTRRIEVFDMEDGQEKKAGVDGAQTGLALFKRSVAGITALHNMMQAAHNRKTSTVSTVGRHIPKQPNSNKDHPTEKSDSNTYMLCSSPPPLSGPPIVKLNIQIAGENVTISNCVIPDEIIIEILSERLMQNDCQKGIVFDGLECLFSPSLSCTAQLILHSLNNRRFLYFVTLKKEFKSIKEEENDQEEINKALKIKEEQDEILWMQEMTEEEYEMLDEETRNTIEEKRIKARKEKKKQELEEKEKERQIQEEHEAELQRQKDEKAKQKGSKKGQSVDDRGKSKTGKETSLGKNTRENTTLNKDPQIGVIDKHITERPDSHLTEMSFEADEKKKKNRISDKKSVGKIDELPKESQESVDEVKDPKKEQEWLLHQKFKTFDTENKQITEILSYWDRAHPPIKPNQLPAEHLENTAEEGAANQPKRLGRATAINKRNKDHGINLGQQLSHSPIHDENVDGLESGNIAIQEEFQKVPNIVIDVSKKSNLDRNKIIEENLEAELPCVDEVLEGLGLGQKGPPIPPEATFSIVQYPVRRRGPNFPEMIGENGHYNFLGTLEDKEDEKGLKDIMEKDEVKQFDKIKEDINVQSNMNKTARPKKNENLLKEKATKDRKGSGKKSNLSNSIRRGSQSATSISSIPTPISDDGLKLQTYRWIIQPESEINLRLRFKSDELGQFDQSFNFEILDTRRKYQVFCRGICAFPNISKEPRIVFPHRKRNKESREIVQNKYIIDMDVYEFGPLLIQKDKQRILDATYPENMEEIVIKNTSPLLAEINFSFLNDAKNERFALDPSTMTLQSEESQKLKVWAFPKLAQKFDDAIICCIKENPEPVIYNISCLGVSPFVELDTKVIHFDRVLLHRKDMKSIFLRNSTCLPVYWQITGLDSLGDEFSFAQDSGVIEPLSEFKLNAYFRAMKPYKANQKKNIRIEISDGNRLAGILQTESVQIVAEAYDVALDMSFPKGANNGIDMGTLKVGDENKQIITLKNRGPYEIEFKFELDLTENKKYNLNNLFTLSPSQGKMSPGEKAVQVQITYCAKEEVVIKDEQILKCHVIEPNIAEKGEVIAIIPIRISAKSFYSKYQITPKADINFGSVSIQTRKVRQIIIENTGEFDFRFNIKSGKPIQNVTGPLANLNKDTGQKDSITVQKSKQNENILVGGSQSRLQVGNFVLFPATAVVPIKNSVIVTVECISDNPGKCDENLIIDITDRNPRIDLNGVSYRLFVEAFIPSIDSNNLSSIFEEHRIYDTLAVINKELHQLCSGGIYGKTENRFLFTNVLVGSKVEARFRLDNPNNIPCDISLSLKPLHGGRSSMGGRGSASVSDIFEVEPTKAQIEPRGFTYICIVFSPLSMQQYIANFECSIEGLPQNSPYRSKALSFEVCGEGYLPKITVTKPALRNKKSQYVCLFKKSLLGRVQSQNVDLYNDGCLPCRVHIDIVDPDSVFTVNVGDQNETDQISIKSKQPHDLVLSMDVGSKSSFDVLFKPKLSGKYIANVKITVVNNQYEDTIIQLIGEGYEDFITFENLPMIETNTLPIAPAPPVTQTSGKQIPQPPPEEVIDAWKNNILNFGDCYVNEPKSMSFILRNHSEDISVRFTWPIIESTTGNQGNILPVKFSPSVGHLHPGQSISIIAAIQSVSPKTWHEKPIQCKLVKINLSDLESGEKPLNWDDTKKTMKWIDTPHDNNGTITTTRKKKIIETEPEPKYTEIPETSRSLDLLVTANINYCKFKCKVSEVNFQDTMLFETRIYGISLKNEGQIKMRYRWSIKLDNSEIFTPRSSRPSTARLAKLYEIEDEDLNNPFTISPHEGIIKVHEKQKFEVSFNPLNVDLYKATMVCKIENLDPSANKPSISLSGRSLQPFCHFELTDSDYLISGRRDPTMRGPGGAPPGNGINPNTRVIEICVTGLTSRHTKFFNVVNPTKNDFAYQWICEDAKLPRSQVLIQNLATSGTIEAGKKIQCGFQFTSLSVGVVESFWRFEISDIGIVVPFLIVGQCTEPNVAFDKSHFKFPALLVGHESVEIIDIINFDNQPYNFVFQDISRHAPGHSNSLSIEPIHGIVPANSKVPIYIGFTATGNQALNFNLICQVDKKSYPLSLNVKAEGYSVESTVWFEDNTGHSIELIPCSKNGDQEVCNTVNIGRLEVGEQQTRWITLVNDGKFNYDFKWDLKWKDDPKLDNMLLLTPTSGTVIIGEKLKCDLQIVANRSTTFNKVTALLNIGYGNSYLINIIADIHKPILEFSFSKFDFGHCFVYRAGMKALSTELIIRNKDSKNSNQKPVSIECLTESNDVFMHNFEAAVMVPGASTTIEITFLPRIPKRYQQNLIFEINGISKYCVELTGSCEELKLETIGLPNHTVNLGMIKVGEKVNKSVTIANSTHVPITTKLLFSPACEELQQRGVFKIIQLGQDLTINPGKANGVPIQISYSPNKRISKFNEEVYCEAVGVTFPIFMITGGCQAHDIRLDVESLSFGLVTKGSQITKKLSMINYGDIGARFKWNIEAFKPDFVITPVSGYISPGMEVVFEICFIPTKPSPDIRYDNLQCTIEGWKNLAVVLTGVCQNAVPVKETLNFNAPVRQQEVKSLKIGNNTNATWYLKPVIEGEHWIGSETFIVEAQQTKNYEIVFKPLTMTTDGKKHQGSVFIAIPDGTGILYNLTGNTEPPKAITKISREVPSRTSFSELLDVPNWLKRPQRFKVVKEILKPEKSESAISIKGFDYIDVPGGGSKQYKLTILTQKEGLIQLKVTFVNESSGEYQFYEFQIKAFKPPNTAVIALTSPVRQSIQESIILENVLNIAVNYQITSTSPEIHCTNQFQVQPQTKIPFTFEFFPLRVGETQAKLEISSPESGNISYELELSGTPSRPEQPLIFNTGIGTCQTLLAHFKNWAKNKTDFICKIDNSKFRCEKSITVAPNVEAQLEVQFEPGKLGESKGLLTISNSVAGEFIFPLLGTSTLPKPQGPYTIKAGSNVSLNFRNVFADPTQFYFQIDNPEFHINKNSENIKSHKEHRMVVGFDGSSDGGPVMGKLVVTCPELADNGLNKLQWVYYLRGAQKE